MEIPTRQDVIDLLKSARGDVVSLYMPTHRQKETAVEDPIRLKNLLRRAEEQLLERGHRSVDVRAQLEPGRALLEDIDFWSDRGAGLALFMAPGFFRAFRTPIAFDELALVFRQFAITPLTSLLTDNGAFYVLAVSQKRSRLLQGDRFSEHVVEVEGLPPKLAEALNYQPPERMLQANLFVRGANGVRLRSVHGAGGASDYAKEEVLEYFRLVDKALHPYLRDKRLPLVFAGVDYLLPIYREANSYPHLHAAHIHGSADAISDHELHRLAWELVRPGVEQPRQDALNRMHQLADSERDTYELPQILRAAHEGRVDTLCVSPGAQVWGTFDPLSEQIAVPGTREVESDELLNRAAIDTLTHGGKIYLADRGLLPRQSEVAALYRYTVKSPDAVAAVQGNSS